MPNYHLHATAVSRSNGHSSIASAAYQSGEELSHEQQFQFEAGIEHRKDLNKGLVTDKLREEFKSNGIILSENATAEKGKRNHWAITDGDNAYEVKGWNKREKDEDGKRKIVEQGLDIYGDTVHDYATRETIVDTWIQAPEDSPDWVYNRQTLWNNAEKAEPRRDSATAYKVEFALPRELNDEQNKAFIENYVNEQFTSKGIVADIAIHSKTASDGKENIHVHIQVAVRRAEEHGFSEVKNEEWGNNWQNNIENKQGRVAQLAQLRESYAAVQNRHLEAAGIDKEVDHRSYKEQGIKFAPTIHMGKRVAAAEEKGIKTSIGDENRRRERANIVPKFWYATKETAAKAWEKGKAMFGRKQEESAAVQHVPNVMDQQQVSSEVAQPDHLPERAATERQESGDIFERLTGRATISQEETERIREEREREEREKDREIER